MNRSPPHDTGRMEIGILNSFSFCRLVSSKNSSCQHLKMGFKEDLKGPSLTCYIDRLRIHSDHGLHGRAWEVWEWTPVHRGHSGRRAGPDLWLGLLACLPCCCSSRPQPPEVSCFLSSLISVLFNCSHRCLERQERARRQNSQDGQGGINGVEHFAIETWPKTDFYLEVFVILSEPSWWSDWQRVFFAIFEGPLFYDLKYILLKRLQYYRDRWPVKLPILISGTFSKSPCKLPSEKKQCRGNSFDDLHLGRSCRASHMHKKLCT